MDLRCLCQPDKLSGLNADQRNHLENQLQGVCLDDPGRFPLDALMAVSTLDKPQAEALKVPVLLMFFIFLVWLRACLPSCLYGS